MTESTGNLDYIRLWQHVDELPWCALVTTGRTGTDFFQSLLDSHPQISVFNGIHFFHSFWLHAQAVNYGGPLILEDVLDEYIGAHLHKLRTRYDIVEQKGELGEQGDSEIAIDRDAFRHHVRELLRDRPVTSRNFLLGVQTAFDLCLDRDMFARKAFLHHSHRIGRVHRFLNDYPNSKVVCMVRDPRANYVSGVEHWRNYEPNTDNPSYPIYIIWRAVDEMAQLRDIPKDELVVLRLEDLGNTDALRKFCDWIGISYDPCLEHSTWGGLRWWGDKISERKIPTNETGFSPTMIRNRWQDRLGRVDQFVLNHILAPMIGTYGYEKGIGDRAAWAPVVALAILLPTVYERRYLSPRFVFNALRRGKVRVLLRSVWHPLRRMRLFYGWLWRRHAGGYFAPRWLMSTGDQNTGVQSK